MTKSNKHQQNDILYKKDLCDAVYHHLDNKIDYTHIVSIISILMEEMVKDLFNKGKFYIGNFGWFIFKRLPPRGYFNFQTGKVERSEGNKILRFKINKKLKRNILDNLDIARTFDDEHNK